MTSQARHLDLSLSRSSSCARLGGAGLPRRGVHILRTGGTRSRDITDTWSQLLLGLVFTPARPAIHAFYEPPDNGLDQPGYEHCGDPTGREYKNIHHEASPSEVCGSRIRQHVM